MGIRAIAKETFRRVTVSILALGTIWSGAEPRDDKTSQIAIVLVDTRPDRNRLRNWLRKQAARLAPGEPHLHSEPQSYPADARVTLAGSAPPPPPDPPPPGPNPCDSPPLVYDASISQELLSSDRQVD